jgi:hypothetical protein
MITTMRRMFWLALLGGAAYAGWTAWHRQNAPTAADAPQWPPLDPPLDAAATPAGFATLDPDRVVDRGADEASTRSGPPEASADTRWALPIDGECPEGFPIKANDNSGIYHVPGGRFYARTIPERCYARSQDAVADGYRAAKS